MNTYPYNSIMTASQAVAFLASDDVVALRIRGRPYIERFERPDYRRGSMYAAEIVALDVVEVIFDYRESGRIVTDRLFVRPGDAEIVRREFPDCCEPVTGD